MARTDDIPTTIMPRSLLVLAGVLLAFRLVVWSSEALASRPAAQQIAWTEMSKHVAAEDGSKPIAYVPPPLPPTTLIAWSELNKQAAASGGKAKPILIEFYAVGSEPCQRMDEKVFSSKQVAELIKSEFIPVRVTDRLKKDGVNPPYVTDLQKKYRVFAFPTLIVARPDGESMAALIGSSSALATYQFLSRAAHAYDR